MDSDEHKIVYFHTYSCSIVTLVPPHTPHHFTAFIICSSPFTYMHYVQHRLQHIVKLSTSMLFWHYQVGEAAGATSEACQLVDSCRSRLRAVAQAVATVDHRPRVLSLEGLTPLVLGALSPPLLPRAAWGEWRPGDETTPSHCYKLLYCSVNCSIYAGLVI